MQNCTFSSTNTSLPNNKILDEVRLLWESSGILTVVPEFNTHTHMNAQCNRPAPVSYTPCYLETEILSSLLQHNYVLVLVIFPGTSLILAIVPRFLYIRI